MTGARWLTRCAATFRCLLFVLVGLLVSGPGLARADPVSDAWTALAAEDWHAAETLIETADAAAITAQGRHAVAELRATLRYYLSPWPQALQAARALDASARRDFGADAPERLVALSLLGWLYDEDGDPARALQPLTRAVWIGQSADEPPDILLPQLLQLADIYLSLGEPDTTAMLGAHVQAEAAALWGASDPVHLEALLIGGQARLAQSRPALAVAQVLDLWPHLDVIQADPFLQDRLALYLETLEHAAGQDAALLERWSAAAGQTRARRVQQQDQAQALLPDFFAAQERGDAPALDRALTRIVAQVDRDGADTALLFLAGLRAQMALDQPQRALGWADRLLAFPAGYLSVLDLDPARLQDLASRLPTGRQQARERLARAQLAILLARHDPWDERVQQSQLFLAWILQNQTRPDAALALVSAVMDSIQATGAPGSALHLEALSLTATLAADRQDSAAARAALEEMLRLGQGDAQTRYQALSAMVDLLLDSPDNSTELPALMDQVDQLALQLYGPDSVEMATQHMARAVFLLNQGQDQPQTQSQILAQVEAARRALDKAGIADRQVDTLLTLLDLRARFALSGGQGPQLDQALDRALDQAMDGVAQSRDPVFQSVLAEAAFHAREPALARALAQAVLEAPAIDPASVSRAGMVQARLALQDGQPAAALGWLRMLTAELTGAAIPDRRLGLRHLPLHIATLLFLAEQDGADADALLAEALIAAQLSSNLAAGHAFQQATQRWTGPKALAEPLRQQQDLQRQTTALRQQMVQAAAQGQPVQALLTKLHQIETDLTALQSALRADHPGFAALRDPQASDLASLSAVLAPDEALLIYLTGDIGFAGAPASHVLVITQDRLQVERVGAASELRRLARDLRCAAALTDLGCLWQGVGQGGALDGAETRGTFSTGGGEGGAAFDFDLSYQAYRQVLAPVAQALQGKTRLIVVPDQTLLALPFALMTTQPPGAQTSLRNADWLIRSTSVRIMPTVSSFLQLREAERAAGPGQTRQGGFLGIGDPLIGAQRDGPLPFDCADASTAPSGPFSPRARSALQGQSAVTQLEALPDSRCELQGSARAWDGPSQVLLHDRASESHLAQLNASGGLRDYAAITFATHGLVDGELGDFDAGLVLTPTPGSDGLLTTAEIAALDLDARMVILSACNTAAGGAGNAQALSGLASAFFQAGARSVMVSNWPVYSDAAVRLSSGTLRRVTGPGALPAAEALRLAMLDILTDPGSGPHELHPAYWAPFFVAGGG